MVSSCLLLVTCSMLVTHAIADDLQDTINVLSRQLAMQQLFTEERVRSDGDSGIKQIRHASQGTRPYYSDSHTGAAVMSVHDHANNVRALGMGEFVAVLNGVEFRTRHNDYMLVRPDPTSQEYGKTVEIDYPNVPTEVSDKATVSEQVDEMKLWFKAWKDQDHSARDYRPYFKPLLCYMEGAWTKSDPFTEPFFSDRHALDASSWSDLQEKVRFTSYTGGKSNLENYAFLPTTVTQNGDDAEIAQWNYRIVCHPVNRDIPLNRLRVVDELASRLALSKTVDEYAQTRTARFQLNPSDTGTWSEERIDYGLLDELMAEIPGKNNYPGFMTDEAFDIEAYKYKLNANGGNADLNAAYYHRWFRAGVADAMGRTIRHRGFSDANLFMAMNTQQNVVASSVKDCSGDACNHFSQRWSYAIPLEIVYMTPLLKWNPYDIEYKGVQMSVGGQAVIANGRDGSTEDASKAYDGSNSKVYYRTPAEFFSSGELTTHSADTVQNEVGVLDRDGVLRVTRASGTRIFLPEIDGVGMMRTRYPIAPVHGEGGSVWKELDALKEIVLNRDRYNDIL